MKFLINRVFSDAVKEMAPDMILFLEQFINWMSKKGNGINLIETLSTNQDLTLVSDEFVNYISEVTANDFPISISNNLKLLLKQVLTIYKSKSNIDCFEYLFQTFYNSDINLIRPWDYVLKLNSSIHTISRELYISGSAEDNTAPLINNVVLFNNEPFIINRHEYNTEDLIGWLVIGEISGCRGEIINLVKSETDNYILSLNNVTGSFRPTEALKLVNADNGDDIENDSYTNTCIFVYKYPDENLEDQYKQVDGVYIPENTNWSSQVGRLDSNIVLQDSKWYQEFSYTIESSVSLKRWMPIIKLLLHPAGFYMHGKLISNIDNSILYYNRSYLLDPDNPEIYYSLLGNDIILEDYTPDTALGRMYLSNYMLATYPLSNNYDLDFTANELVYPQFVEKDKFIKSYYVGLDENYVYNIDGKIQYNNWFNDYNIKWILDNFKNWLDEDYVKYRVFSVDVNIDKDSTDFGPKLLDNQIVQDKSRQLEYEKYSVSEYNNSVDSIYLYIKNKKELDRYRYFINNESEFIEDNGKYYYNNPGSYTEDVSKYAGELYRISKNYKNISEVEVSGEILDEYSIYINPDVENNILSFDYEYIYYGEIDSSILEKVKNIKSTDIIWLLDDNECLKNNIEYVPLLTKDGTVFTDRENKSSILFFDNSVLYNFDIIDFYDYDIDYNFGKIKPFSTFKNITLAIENDSVYTKIKGTVLKIDEDKFSDKNVMIFSGGLHNSNYKMIKNLTLNTYLVSFDSFESEESSIVMINDFTKSSIINKLYNTRVKIEDVSNTTAVEISSTSSSLQLSENQLIKIPENYIDIDKENTSYIFNTGSEYVEEEQVVIYNYKNNYFSGRLFLEKIGNVIDITYDLMDNNKLDTKENFIINDYIQLKKSSKVNNRYTQNYIVSNSRVNDVSIYLDRIILEKNNLLVFYNGLITTSYNLSIEKNNLDKLVTKISNISYAQKNTNKITYEFISYNLSDISLDTDLTKDGQIYNYSLVSLDTTIDSSVVNNGTYNTFISDTLFSKCYLNDSLLYIFNALQTNPDLQIEIYLTSDLYNHTLNNNTYNYKSKNFVNYDVYTNNNTLGYANVYTLKSSKIEYNLDVLPKIRALDIENIEYSLEDSNHYLTLFNKIENNYSILSTNVDKYHNLLFFGNSILLNFGDIEYQNRVINNDIGFNKITVFPFKDTYEDSLKYLFFVYNKNIYVHMSDYVSYFIDNNKYTSFDSSLKYTENDTELSISDISFNANNTDIYGNIFEDTTTGLDKIISEDYMFFLNGAKIIENEVTVENNYYYTDSDNFYNNYIQNILYKNLNIEETIGPDYCVHYKNRYSYNIKTIDETTGDDIIYCNNRQYIKLDDIVPYENEVIIGNTNNYICNIYKYNKNYLTYYTYNTFSEPVDKVQILLDINEKTDILAFKNGSFIDNNINVYKNRSKKYNKSNINTIYNYTLDTSITLEHKNIKDLKVYDAVSEEEYKNYSFDGSTVTLNEKHYVKIVYTYITKVCFNSIVIKDTYIIPDTYTVSNLNIYYGSTLLNINTDYSFRNNKIILDTKYKNTGCILEYEYVYNDEYRFSDQYDNEESGYYIEMEGDIHNFEVYVFDQGAQYNLKNQKYYIGSYVIADNILNQPIFIEYSDVKISNI